MKQINELINYFKNMTEEKIVDILIAIIIVILFCLFSSLISYLIIKLFNLKEKDKEIIKQNPFYKPFKTLLIFIGIYFGIYILNFPKTIMSICTKIFRIIVVLVIAKGLINAVDPNSNIAKKFSKKDASNKDKTVANFISKILKYIIYIFEGFFIITELGYNISGLVAGLGIGGAIVALAAQDFVKSLIAGFSILLDKPFLVGDWIQVEENQGTVVDISFRTTKIKTMDNTIITYPNITLTSTSVTNWSKMKERRYVANLKLPLETNSDIIEKIVNRIKFMLQSNENINSKTIEVNFDKIEQSGINIYVYAYTQITEYNKFLRFTQIINMEILKILEAENIKLSYPGQNIYIMNQE